MLASTGRAPIFYGWWILAAGFGTRAISAALFFHALGTYVDVIEDEFGWSRSVLAFAFATQRVERGLIDPVQGWMIDKWGPRRVMIAGMLIFGAGLILLSRIDSLGDLYIAFLVIAVGSSLGTDLGVTVAAVHWFRRRRAWTLALLMMGGAAGGLLEPIVVPALEAFSWRSGAFVSGLLIIAIGVPLAAVMRHRPEDHGYRIDGGPRGGEATHEELPEEVNFTARQALRTRAFWFLAMGHATAVAAIGSVGVHFVVYSRDSLDLSLRAGAFVIMLMSVSAVVGLLGGGYLADRANKRLLIACALLGLAISVMALALASAYWMLIVFAVLASVGSGALRPTLLAMLADYFGVKAIGTIMGFSSLLMMFAGIFGPVFVGVIHDMTGSYRGAFLVLACAAVVGALLFWLAVKPTLPDTAEAGTADPAPA